MKVDLVANFATRYLNIIDRNKSQVHHSPSARNYDVDSDLVLF